MGVTSSPCSVCGGLIGWPCHICASSRPHASGRTPDVCARPECLAEHARVAHVAPSIDPAGHLDEFFDGELPADQAELVREHLATCELCQDVLHGKMQEAAAVSVTPGSAAT